MNDGTGTVFFFVFLGWYEMGSFSVGEFFHKFFRLAVGGPLFGYIIALIFYPILKKILKYENAFVISTVILAYSTFFLAESGIFKIHVSGILALVVLGLYFSMKLKGRVVGKVEEAMHFIWHFLAWIIETLLFFITGGFLGAFIAGYDDMGMELNILDASIIWKLFTLQIMLLILRGFILVLFWPFLNKVGRKINWKEIIVMSYAGLRGAIGLSLALYVKRLTISSPHINIEDLNKFKLLTILYTAFTILWTVLV